MEITCYRDQKVGHESRYLSAANHNLARAILDLDTEKFMFMDSERKCWIGAVWRNFRPGARTSRDQPVEHDALC